MFNEEMEALGSNGSVIREISDYAEKRVSEIGRDKVFNFSIGNPSIPAPQKVTEVMKDLIENLSPQILHGYTSAQGDINVRRKIAENIKARFNAECTHENIYIT